MTGQHPLVGVGPRDVVPLATLVDGWLQAGLISAEQAARLTTAAALPATAPRREGVPVVAEALAYVGGAVVLAGSSLLTAYYWGELAASWRFLLLAVATLVLLGAGAAVPRRLAAAGRRLRGVLWLAATAAWAGAAAVLVGEVVPDAFGSETEPVLVAGTTVCLAGLLWALHRFVLQQLALLVSGAVLVGTAIAWSGLPVEPGVGVWVLGASWAALGATRVVQPAETPILLGAATAVFGSMTAGDSDAGMVFVLVTVAAVVAAAIARHDLALLGLGALATMVNVPAAMSRWFAGSVPAATALVVVGLLLVAVAVSMTRRGRPAPPR
ncbi:DUF2157 domain-containing protein [Nocardioides aquiterrae]|uniref:DUF2157 domain-containing protein n=1 Tax=Nocardioides aquiterrae TaxID=203799 RepID=A0ABN1UJZ8_9ACTN